MENNTTGIGHNQPPDPVEEVLAPYDELMCEAQSWLDGETVKTAGQSDFVDDLISEIKTVAKDLEAAKKAATKPLHDAWKSEVARWKPATDDLDMMLRGLQALNVDFKRAQVAAQEQAKRDAWEAARAKERAAEAAAEAATGNIEAMREAAAIKQEAQAAKEAASKASKATVKGLRTVTRYEIMDRRAALNWIARNDADALAAFLDAYAATHLGCGIDGVKTWQEKVAR